MSSLRNRMPETRMAEASKAPANMTFPTSGKSKHAIVLMFKEYKHVVHRELNSFGGRTVTGYRSGEGIRGSVILPLPQNIQDTFNLRVQGGELGIFGNLVAAGGSSSIAQNNLFTGAKDVLDQTLMAPAEWIAGVMKGETTSDELAATRSILRRAVDNTGLGRAIDTSLGTISNPHMTVMFDGVDLKSHSFNWSLAPRNSEDSMALRDIDRFIHRSILPTYGDVGPLQKGLLRYPCLVDIYFQGIDQNFFCFYKTAMVQSYSMDFTPNGVSLLKGGRPAFVNMAMTLTETSIHTADDYRGEGE